MRPPTVHPISTPNTLLLDPPHSAATVGRFRQVAAVAVVLAVARAAHRGARVTSASTPRKAAAASAQQLQITRQGTPGSARGADERSGMRTQPGCRMGWTHWSGVPSTAQKLSPCSCVRCRPAPCTPRARGSERSGEPPRRRILTVHAEVPSRRHTHTHPRSGAPAVGSARAVGGGSTATHASALTHASAENIVRKSAQSRIERRARELGATPLHTRTWVPSLLRRRRGPTSCGTVAAHGLWRRGRADQARAEGRRCGCSRRGRSRCC